MNIEQMLDAIRDVIGQTIEPELAVMEALVAEADTWRARLGELQDEDDEG